MTFKGSQLPGFFAFVLQRQRKVGGNHFSEGIYGLILYPYTFPGTTETVVSPWTQGT